MGPKKTVIITDLDNTLFDWVELWLNCFSTMLDGIVEISRIPKEKLIPEISTVHQIPLYYPNRGNRTTFPPPRELYM